MNQIIAIVESYQNRGYRMTVRQVYYQLVARNILRNSDPAYNKTSKVLTMARMEYLVDWDAIVDRVRIPVMPNQYKSMSSFIDAMKNEYRTYRWKDQRHYVEVMVEKEALAGILEPITNKYHVSLLVNKGYASSSAIYDVVLRMFEQGERQHKKCHILYLGDHDPSGIDMVRDIESRLVNFEIFPRIERIALNLDQIRQYKPPPNPTKITDPRAKQYCEKYGNRSWELDALDPEVLANILETSIQKYLNIKKYNNMIEKENAEKNALDTLAKKLDDMNKT